MGIRAPNHGEPREIALALSTGDEARARNDAEPTKNRGVYRFARLGGRSLELDTFGVELGTFGVELETFRAVEVVGNTKS